MTNPTALEAAFRYPPYELPIDMWKSAPSMAEAPRRLARTPAPGGGVWAVHSSFLPKDSVGRDRSYFSHLLRFASIDCTAVLRSWAADEWATSYPPGDPKSLPGKVRLPVGPLVSDDALTMFLGDPPMGPTELSVSVCPTRLRGAPGERRDLFARVFLAVLQAAEDNNRRLYVHAEPGVVALLLYGAVRLLPHSMLADLTFSTYEPYHRNIRDYKLARVVGTYLGPGNQGLGNDLISPRTTALDTFHPAKSSSELRKPL